MAVKRLTHDRAHAIRTLLPPVCTGNSTAWLANTEGTQFCSQDCAVADGAQPVQTSGSCSLAGCSRKPLHHRQTGKAFEYCSEGHRVREQQLATVRVFLCPDIFRFLFRCRPPPPSDNQLKVRPKFEIVAPSGAKYDRAHTITYPYGTSVVACCFRLPTCQFLLLL